MSVIGSNILAGASGNQGYFLTNSLRFRASASAYLNRTFGAPTLSTKWTWSGWFKLGSITSSNKTIFDGGSPDTRISYEGTGQGPGQIVISNDTTTFLLTSPIYRDYSSWYHLVVAFDSSQGTASNRLRLYVNGSEVTAFATDNRSSISGAIGINTATAHGIGKQPAGGVAYFDGYMAEINFVDGQQLTPSSFGQTSSTTGVWQPIKYTGTYGNNGFYLPFTDNSALTTSSNAGLGKDFSGNANYWTTNNISITSGETYDSMTDVPTLTSATAANYAVLNPLSAGASATLSSGNLNASLAASTATAVSTIAFDAATTTGFYAECLVTTSTVGGPLIGIRNINTFSTSYIGSQATDYSIYSVDGDKYNNGSSSAYGSATSDGNVIGIAVKNGKIYFRNNNGWFNSADFSAETGFAFSGITGTYIFGASNSNATTVVVSFNFGQRPFAYTPPTGFVALNTFNLPTPTIGATASSQANKYMNIALYTGTGSSQSITGLGFQPDWTWIKGRSGATDHGLYDAVRGVQNQLESNTTTAETAEATGLTAFGSDGFTVGALAQLNTSSATYVAWNWKANGAGSTNTAGTITSTVSANTSAGFSIVTYTGTGSAATVGHGLGVAPSMVIVKSKDQGTTGYTGNWYVYHASNTSAPETDYLLLNTTAATADDTFWNDTLPTSTVFSIGALSGTNDSGDAFVAYCFAQIAGYSAFGSYTGNASTNGPFVYTGFRPRFILIKNSNVAGNNWWLLDTARSTYNVQDALLNADTSGAENNTTAVSIDFLSNGFKPRTTDGGMNGSGNTMIFMAFAESPFKFSNAR